MAVPRLVNGVVRLLYPFGSCRRVLKGPLRTMRFKVAPAMGLTYALGRDAYHFAWLARRIRPGMTVYDVGANRGQLTLFFARAVGPAGAVVSFEPVGALFADLEANVRLNGLAQVRPYRLALADRCGAALFAFSGRHPTQGKLVGCEPSYDNPEATAAPVEAAALDELVARDRLPPPGLLKIDVEGAAALVLRGAARTIERHAPDVFIELHGGEEQQAVKEHLLARGYRLETLDGAAVADPTRGWHSPLWCTRSP
jgi:FkbM family methyltransferase